MQIHANKKEQAGESMTKKNVRVLKPNLRYSTKSSLSKDENGKHKIRTVKGASFRCNQKHISELIREYATVDPEIKRLAMERARLRRKLNEMKKELTDKKRALEFYHIITSDKSSYLSLTQ